jgi:hypothetical protein
MAAKGVFPGTVANERLGFSPGTIGATVSEVECVLTGSAAEPVVIEVCGGLCDEPFGDHDREVCETDPARTQTAGVVEFFECEEEFLQIAAPTFAAGPGIVSEVGNDATAVCCKEAVYEAIASARVFLPWCGDDIQVQEEAAIASPMVGLPWGGDVAQEEELLQIAAPTFAAGLSIISEVGNDATAAGCKEAFVQEEGAIASTMVLPWCGEVVGSVSALDPGFGCPAIPVVDAEETACGAMLLGEIQKQRRRKGKKASPCAIPAGAARTAFPAEASGSDVFAEVGKHGLASSSVGGGAGPLLQVFRQAAPGRGYSALGFSPETEVLDEVLPAMDVPMGHRAEPQVVGALLDEPTIADHALVQGSGVHEETVSVMEIELGAPDWQHVLRRRARQRGLLSDSVCSEGKGSLSSNERMLRVKPSSPTAHAANGRGSSQRVSCSMALGSAVLARPTESEEIRGSQAASDDFPHGFLVPAVPLWPVRAGIGKGLGQRDRDCSLATSVHVAEERHEESGGLCGEETADGIADAIARRSEECFDDLEMLCMFVNELEGLSDGAKRRWVEALRPFLERVVRAEAWTPVFNPVELAVLAEIQIHIGQPSLPAISGDHALPAGSFDGVALLEGGFAGDLEAEGLCARGSSMQELAVTPCALNLESAFVHMCVGHVGEERVICDIGSDWGELAESHAHVNSVSVVSPSVCRQVSRCVSVIPLYFLHLSLLCVLLGIGASYHAVLEFEIVDFASGGQDVALVLGQFVLIGGSGAQVPVEALFGEFSGRTVVPTVSGAGLKTKKTTDMQAGSKNTVKQALSKKGAAKASISGQLVEDEAFWVYNSNHVRGVVFDDHEMTNVFETRCERRCP